MRQKKPMFYSAVMLTAVNLLLRLFSTSFQVYVSGRIGASGMGLLQLVLSVSGMAMTVGMAGIRTAVMYLTAEELGKQRPGHVHWILRCSFLYSLVCSCCVGSAIYFFAPAICSFWIGDPRTLGALRLFALFLPVTCMCGVMTGYFTAANRIGTLAVIEIAEQICSMGVTLAALAFYADHDPGKSCLSVILGSCVGTCLTLGALLILRIQESSGQSPRIPVVKRLTDIAVPLALADNLKSGISTVENLMVPKRLSMHTANSLALFGTVCGMVFPIMMFPAAILFGLTELLVPELARCSAAGSQKRIHYLAGRSLRVALLYGITFCGLLFLLSGELCQALYHDPRAGHYLKWFSLLVPMLYCDAITDSMIKGLGQQKISVRYNILTSFLDIVFLYFLLPAYGMAGYFISFLVTHLLNFILSLGRLLKITRLSFPARIPMLSILALLLSIFLCSGLTHPLLRGTAFLAMLGSLLVLFHVVSQEDLVWIKGLIYQK